MAIAFWQPVESGRRSFTARVVLRPKNWSFEAGDFRDTWFARHALDRFRTSIRLTATRFVAREAPSKGFSATGR